VAWTITAEPARFHEACDWLLRRVVLTRAEVERLGAEAGRRAFWVGRGLELAQIQRVFDEINAALEKGESFADFRERVRGELRDDVHAETVFRNATQRAFNAGRYWQQHEPDVLRVRPYGLFDGIRDHRQSPICRQCHGTILPLDDPWWDTHTPLLHHRCRSSVRTLRRSEALRRGVTSLPPTIDAQKGFGLSPELEPEWRPDPEKHDRGLLNALDRKLDGPRAIQPAPKLSPKEHDPEHWEQQYEEQYGDAAKGLGWGRALYERALDRPAGEVVAELERLTDAGHPVMAQPAAANARVLLSGLDPTRPLRGSLGAELFRGLVALSEHTRTITPIARISLSGSPLPPSARRFFELTLDRSVRWPSDWTVEQFGGRSHADPNARALRVQIGAGPGMFVHEIAHAIEFVDARALGRSRAFLRARTQGELLRPLAELDPGKLYLPDEWGRRDKFLRPYMGKDYGLIATEITSMGYEMMTVDFQALAREDWEMALFLLGQLAGR
jgi:SPP1 gp7 family putative phage head morphogenesis protein